MKLKIRKNCSDGTSDIQLYDEDTFYIIAKLLTKNSGYDPSYFARLFQSAEELLESVADRSGPMCRSDYEKKWVLNGRAKKLVAYIKNGDETFPLVFQGKTYQISKQSKEEFKRMLEDM